MKPKLDKFTQHYRAALRRYLLPDVSVDLHRANRLGRQALSLGLGTLDMARIHESAMLLLSLPVAFRIERVDAFFTEAISPITETFRAHRESRFQISQLNSTLGLRTRELASAQRVLKQGVVQRKNGETALKKCNAHYTILLKQSLHLQNGLRQLTHQLLGAQEKERKKYSERLENELAQALVGVNVRLINLKKESAINFRSLKKQIADTEKSGAQSAHPLRRVATKVSIS